MDVAEAMPVLQQMAMKHRPHRSLAAARKAFLHFASFRAN
ncbi:hypothetical protein J2T08_001976 [Neorhizobium galegae]|nr:hypothetical protein [Neorhizobium galegae]MDQ0134058.1 hypothetical protein [Neorhizobium galegae]